MVQSVGRAFDAMCIGYLRFELPNDSGRIRSAELRLAVADNIDTADPHGTAQQVSVFGLPDERAGRRWAERTITWRNAPGLLPGGRMGKNGRIDDAVAKPLGRFVVPPVVMPGTDPPPQIDFSDAALGEFLNDQLRAGRAGQRASVTLILVREAPRAETTSLSFFSKECPDPRLAPALHLTLDGSDGPRGNSAKRVSP